MNLVSELNQKKNEDRSLRPRNLSEFYGQKATREILQVCIAAARKRSDSLDHVLIVGPAGVGKSTLGRIIATEMGSCYHPASGPLLNQPREIIRLLSNLEEKDVLFIDEIHRLPLPCQEILYSAMEDFAVDLVLGGEMSPQCVRIHLNSFTLIGATTRKGDLSQPFKNRFGIDLMLDLYSQEDLRAVLARSAYLLQLQIEDSALDYLTHCSRMTPRIGNKLLRRIRDYVCVEGTERVSLLFMKKNLKKLGIDEFGCCDLDRKILMMLEQQKHPLGIKTLATLMNEEAKTLENDYEPFLLRKGWIEKTVRGRKLGQSAIPIIARLQQYQNS